MIAACAILELIAVWTGLKRNETTKMKQWHAHARAASEIKQYLREMVDIPGPEMPGQPGKYITRKANRSAARNEKYVKR